MARNFVVLARLNREQQALFLDFIQEKNLGWWHWIPNSWLLTDMSDTMTVDVLRDKIGEISDVICAVLQVRSVTWSGMETPGSKMFEWFNSEWKE